MKKSRGFTLIELLAVILILGIIALIAIPTVNNIISEAKKGAFKSTIENLITAAEQKCHIEQMKSNPLSKTYIFNNGDVIPNLDIKGTLPDSGSIILSDECEVSSLDLVKGGFRASNQNGVILITANEYKQVYQAGDLVYFDPVSSDVCNDKTFTGNNTCYKWRVIETADKKENNEIMIMMDHNLINKTAWSVASNTTGPTIAMQSLNDATINWDRVGNLNYTYDTQTANSNYGVLTCENGTCTFAGTVLNGVKARMATGEEITKIVNTKVEGDSTTSKQWTLSSSEYAYYFFSSKKYLIGTRTNGTSDNSLSWLLENTSDFPESNAKANIYGETNNGYWTLSPVSDNSSSVWRVKNNGNFYNQNVDDNTQYGVRPVIVILKIYISQ